MGELSKKEEVSMSALNKRIKILEDKLIEQQRAISTVQEENTELKDKLTDYENRINKIEAILRSVKPLRQIFQRSRPVWMRYYHTDEEFIQSHLHMMWEDGGHIGFAFTVDPNSFEMKSEEFNTNSI